MGVLEEQERKHPQTHQESHFSNSCAESPIRAAQSLCWLETLPACHLAASSQSGLGWSPRCQFVLPRGLTIFSLLRSAVAKATPEQTQEQYSAEAADSSPGVPIFVPPQQGRPTPKPSSSPCFQDSGGHPVPVSSFPGLGSFFHFACPHRF